MKNQIPLPFPSRVPAAKKVETDHEMLDIFKKVEINIPLLDVIKQIPKYAKFLKELCTYKRNLKKKQIQTVASLSQSSLPQKCDDPGTFSVPCTIGEMAFPKALLDLGASINIMPATVYKLLNLGDLRPTSIIIQLANRSTVPSLGVLEDVLVRINTLIFPADFYIMNMQDKTSTTLILGRPFLMTARTKIDVHACTLSMEFGDQIMHFNIYDSLHDLSPSSTAAHCIDIITPHISSIDCITSPQAVDTTSSLNKLEFASFENKPSLSNLIKEVVANNSDVDSMLEALKDIPFEHEIVDHFSADVADLYIDFVFSNICAAAGPTKSECIGLITAITYTSDFVVEKAIELHNSGRVFQTLKFFQSNKQPLLFEEDKKFHEKLIEQERPPPEPPPSSFYLIFILTNPLNYFTNLCFDIYVADIQFPSSAKNPPDTH